MTPSRIRFSCLCAALVAAMSLQGIHAGDPGELECFLEDDFETLENWDVPEPSEGLDLRSCGGPAGVDVGIVEASDNRMLIRPSRVPVPGLDIPLGMIAMSSEAAGRFVGEPSYRMRFDMLARPGIVGAAIFVNQHHLFDEDSATMDIGPDVEAAGMGFTVSFDCPHDLDRVCDHVHPDIRTFCFQESSAEGPDSPEFADLLTESNELYTVILDVEGDDVTGPLWLQMKLFPADGDEPADYLATWLLRDGLGANPDEDFDHGLFIAAIGAPTGVLEIRDLSVCEVPLDHQFVRNLVCFRQLDDSVVLEWENPFGADADSPITIRVNGEDVGEADGDEMNFEIDDLPEEDLVIEVVNFSGSAATCELCFNSPPEARIDGPSSVVRESETVTVSLDSAASTDGDDGGQTLDRFWQVVERPAGSRALIDDPLAERIRLTVDADGEYVVELVVSDSGCLGDFSDAQESEVVHTLSVGAASIAFHRGDANNSGTLEITDGIFILNFLFAGGPAPACREAANSNDDAGLDLTDGVFVLSFLFSGGEAPPSPGPPPADCGPDPDASPSDLGCEEYSGC